MRKKELFDFTNITPKLFTELRVADKTVLQSFNLMRKTTKFIQPKSQVDWEKTTPKAIA